MPHFSKYFLFPLVIWYFIIKMEWTYCFWIGTGCWIFRFIYQLKNFNKHHCGIEACRLSFNATTWFFFLGKIPQSVKPSVTIANRMKTGFLTLAHISFLLSCSHTGHMSSVFFKYFVHFDIWREWIPRILLWLVEAMWLLIAF